jgi:hypothetical protein
MNNCSSYHFSKPVDKLQKEYYYGLTVIRYVVGRLEEEASHPVVYPTGLSCQLSQAEIPEDLVRGVAD